MSFFDERSAFHRRNWLLAAGLGAAVSLAACSAIDSPTARMLDAVTPFHPEVIQGNFISAEQVQAVRPGMSRVQVRDILGTPLVSSAFHENRWDYVFTMKRRKGVKEQRFKLTAFFDGDVLDRVEGDDMPSEDEFVERIDERKKTPKVPPLEARPEQLEKFRANNPSKAGDAGSAGGDEDLPSSSAPQNYPPLEPAR